MAIFNLVGAVGNIKPNKLEDIVNVTGNTTVPTGDSLEVFNAARIDTVDGTPANNTFVIAIGSQSVSVSGNTSADQTAADFVVALNASVLSNFVLRTWENPSGAIIAGIDDVGIADDVYTLTVTGSGSATITDFIFKFTMNMSAGVNLTESGTGFINFQGVRGTFVLFDSNAAQKQLGDWAFVSYSGTGINSNRWCISANSAFGHMAFTDHAPAVDMFSYNIVYNARSNSYFNDSNSAGSMVVEDLALIRSREIFKTGSMTQTTNRLTILNELTSSFLSISANSTWNDISHEGVLQAASFLASAGQLITVNRLYTKNLDNLVGGLFGGIGDVVINDSIIEGGNTAVLFNGAGSLTLNRCDVTNAGNTSSAQRGLAKGGSGTFDITDVHLSGTTGFDLSVVDISTVIPTDEQHFGMTSITTPKSTPNQPRTYSAISVDVSVAEEITFTFTTDVPAGSYVELIDSNGVVIATSPFDAPDVFIKEIGVTIKTKVTDWGLKGQKYKNAHVHKMSAPADTYTWRIRSFDVNDNAFPSDVQASIVVTGAATTAPTPAGGINWETMANLIRKRFKTQIQDLISPDLPTQFDNAPFSKPDKTRWARVVILPGESRQVELGATTRHRTPGVVIVSIFIPLEQGDKEAYVIADLIGNAFRSVSDGGVVYRTPRINQIRRLSKEWQLNVELPFTADIIQ